MTISLIKEPKDWAELEDELRRYEGYPTYDSSLEVHHNKTIKSESYRAGYKDVFFIAECIVTAETKHFGNSSYAIEKRANYNVYAQYYADPKIGHYSQNNVKTVEITHLLNLPQLIYSAFERAKVNFERTNYLPVVSERLFS